VSDGAAQAEILAWLAEDPTRGYRSAAKRWGVPASTIRGWAQAARAGRAPATPNARTRARVGARAREEEAASPEAEPEWDPTSCTREEFLVDRIRASIEARDAAQVQGHGGVARQWETTIGDYRRELDALRHAERREREASGTAAEPDPLELATRILRQLPRLVRVLPRTEGIRLHAELGRALGLTEEEGE
jgi:hypothetical protein